MRMSMYATMEWLRKNGPAHRAVIGCQMTDDLYHAGLVSVDWSTEMVTALPVVPEVAREGRRIA
jgi:hypothetical protein